MFIVFTLCIMVGIAIGIMGTLAYEEYLGHETVAVATVKGDISPEQREALQREMPDVVFANNPKVQVQYVRVPRRR